MSVPIGFFGKLPAHGDFVQRNMPSNCVLLWDSWLQEGLAETQQHLGSQWLDHYLSGPIWKFSLSPDLVGDSARVGAMMPSVDRVGRYFPLITMATIAQLQLSPSMAAVAADQFLDNLSKDMICALEDPCPDAELFSEQIQSTANNFALPITPNNSLSKEQIFQLPGSEQITILKPENTELHTSLELLHDYQAMIHYHQISIWWTEGSELIPAQIRFCPGMPQSIDFMQFYSANENDLN